MNIIVKDLENLFGVLSEHAVICIEGHTGSGKTTTGKKIAETFGYKFFDTDDYIIKDLDSVDKKYEDMIDTKKLSQDLHEEKDKKVIVGICLRKILQACEFTPPMFYIYIKLISRATRSWIEEANIEDFRNGSFRSQGVHLSDYQYILDVNPQSHADVIFERLEQDL